MIPSLSMGFLRRRCQPLRDQLSTVAGVPPRAMQSDKPSRSLPTPLFLL